jgi:transcriptional regulator with XRE-family HTH domain
MPTYKKLLYGNQESKGQMADRRTPAAPSSEPPPVGKINRQRWDEALKNADLNSAQLAAQIGKSPSLLSRWRAGTKVPDGYNLTLVCRALKVTPSWLFGLPEERSDVVQAVRYLLGDAEATVLEAMGSVDDAGRRRIADWVLGMAAGLSSAVSIPGTQNPHSLTTPRVAKKVADKLIEVMTEALKEFQ